LRQTTGAWADALRAARAPRWALRCARANLSARLRLRRCQQVGRRARLYGRCHVDNDGEISIGTHFLMTSRLVTGELVTGPDGRIQIGDHVFMNQGCWISAHRLVRIGDRCQLGPYTLVMDCDSHTPEDHYARDDAHPVMIEEGVWIGARVTVLKGVTIGAGSTIAAGSVVTRDVPPHVVAAGVPARVVRALDGATAVAAGPPPSWPDGRRALPGRG
jgi:acetyltransferase-like isoleucine patch superfamily enzyme